MMMLWYVLQIFTYLEPTNLARFKWDAKVCESNIKETLQVLIVLLEYFFFQKFTSSKNVSKPSSLSPCYFSHTLLVEVIKNLV